MSVSGMGAMMAGGNPANGRNLNDFYPTPWECTYALMLREGMNIPNVVGEPFVGEGHLADVVKLFNRRVIASDIVDYGYPETKVIDFFDIKNDMTGKNFGIISNPPFKLAEKIIRHSLEVMNVGYLALLLKSTYFHAIRRVDLYNKHKPTTVYALTWRPDFMGLGRPTMECIWAVWDKNETPQDDPFYKLLIKPTEIKINE